MTEAASPTPSPSPPPSPAPAAPAAASPPTPLSPATTPITPAPPAAAPATAASARPDWLPQTFADPTAFRADYDRLAAFEASDHVRRATLPPSPNDYKAELPTDFKPPEGVTFQLKTDDPLLAQARTMAHEMGINQ